MENKKKGASNGGVFFRAPKWMKEFEELRKIVLSCGLTEGMKWGWPCYSLDKSNIVLIHGFKDYCALLLFKGALLKDPKGILIQQTANVQVPRQIRFTNVGEITGLKTALKAYIFNAIEVEKSGVKVKLKKTSDYEIPAEFQDQLDKNPALNDAFYALSPGRQRGYIFYFSQAKQSKTREQRIDKYVKKILEGKGMDD